MKAHCILACHQRCAPPHWGAAAAALAPHNQHKYWLNVLTVDCTGHLHLLAGNHGKMTHCATTVLQMSSLSKSLT